MNVVITGASTGIGYATALRLSKIATVYAGVRSESDFAAMGSLGANIVPVYLEVTDRASIAAAAATVVEKTGGTLDALVNNAGIVVAGPLEVVEPEQFEKQMAVNVMGPLYCAQAFLPMIRASKGRIVTIGSISGRISMPYVGPYGASKFAVEALCDSLRLEMAPFGVKVILIEPGAIKTPLWQRTQAQSTAAVERISPEGMALYGEAIERMRTFSGKIEAGAGDVDGVAQVVERALTAKAPQARYVVGTDARVQAVIARLPEMIRDKIILSLLAKG